MFLPRGDIETNKEICEFDYRNSIDCRNNWYTVQITNGTCGAGNFGAQSRNPEPYFIFTNNTNQIFYADSSHNPDRRLEVKPGASVTRNYLLREGDVIMFKNNSGDVIAKEKIVEQCFRDDSLCRQIIYTINPPKNHDSNPSANLVIKSVQEIE